MNLSARAENNLSTGRDLSSSGFPFDFTTLPFPSLAYCRFSSLQREPRSFVILFSPHPQLSLVLFIPLLETPHSPAIPDIELRRAMILVNLQ